MGALGELKKLASQLDQRHLQSKTAELGLMEIQSTRCDLAATFLLLSCDLAATFLLLSYDLAATCYFLAT